MPISLGNCKLTLRRGVWLSGGLLKILKATEIVVGSPSSSGRNDAVKLALCTAMPLAQNSAEATAAAIAASRSRASLAWVCVTSANT
jgi:hypothetical protein